MTDLRSIRRELGLSQSELAARLGLNQSTISRMETGELPLDPRTSLAIKAIEAGLGRAGRTGVAA